MSRSFVDGYLPYNPETTTSNSQLQGNLQESQVPQFPEDHDIAEHSACLGADWAHDVPDDFSPIDDDEADMIPKFAESASTG